jgi:hypothetical protein
MISNLTPKPDDSDELRKAYVQLNEELFKELTAREWKDLARPVQQLIVQIIEMKKQKYYGLPE